MPKEINPGCIDCPLKGNVRLLPLINEWPGVPRTLFVGEAPTQAEVENGELTKGKDTTTTALIYIVTHTDKFISRGNFQLGNQF